MSPKTTTQAAGSSVHHESAAAQVAGARRRRNMAWAVAWLFMVRVSGLRRHPIQGPEERRAAGHGSKNR